MVAPLSKQGRDADREALLGARAPAARPRAHCSVARVAAAGFAVAAGVALLVFRPGERQQGGVSAAVGSEAVDLFSFSWFHKLEAKVKSLLFRCNPTDCVTCLKEKGCMWCPATRNCHMIGSLKDKCEIPINSAGQCWGEGCAYQLGEFLNDRPDDAVKWIEETVKTQATPLQPFPTYQAPATGMFDLATGAPLTDHTGGGAVSGYTIAAIADWGTGTCAARAVARLAAAEKPDMTVHMGDVYFVATSEQFKTNFVGLPKNPKQQGVAFPKGKSVTFAMMGNHELISGCSGLYQVAFPYTGQQTTYAAWQSDSWRIVALDTGRLCYPTLLEGVRNVQGGETDAPMPNEVVEWLTNTLNLGDPSDKRGVVLLSHHQPYDAFSTAYLGAANQLNKILPQGKQVVWLFGHNHALAIYKKMQLQNMNFVMYPRLIGIGGFPNILAAPKKTDGLVAYDARTYQALPDNDGRKQNIGYNGYAKIVISGANMEISYITADCANGNCEEGLSDTASTAVAVETFTADLTTGNVAQTAITIDSALTKVSQPVDEVASVSCIPQSELGNYNASLNHFD